MSNNKITETQIAELCDGMQQIIDTALEQQAVFYDIADNIEEYDYSVSTDDIIYILKRIGIDTIEKTIIKEIPLERFF